MRGLALEGGGAKGAYHIGVVKALIENGYEFDGYVGTSIGAINAAILAQGELDTAIQAWQTISMDKVFDFGERFFRLLDTRNHSSDDDDVPFILKDFLTKLFENKGMGTNKIKSFLEKYINEEKIRSSGKDFGLVTVNLTSWKPHRLMLKDIGEGQLIDYILASASFPGFRTEPIEDMLFLDGGFYDNCPYELLQEQNYDEVIAVRTNAPGIFHKVKDPERVKIISPKHDLGHMMLFSAERSIKNIEHGYQDGLQFVHNYDMIPNEH
jgi:NTE family protein